MGIFWDILGFFGILWDFFLKSVRDFFRVIYPSDQITDIFIAQEPLHSSKPPPSPPQQHITSTPPSQLKNNQSDEIDIKSPSPVSDGRTAQNILEREDTDATSNIGEQNNLYASVHKVSKCSYILFSALLVGLMSHASSHIFTRPDCMDQN